MSTWFSGNSPSFAHVVSEIFKKNELDTRVREHLAKVYSTLCGLLVMAGLGVAADIKYGLGGTMTHIGIIASLVSLVAFRSLNVYQRLVIVGAFGFFKGCSLGSLVHYAIEVDPSIVMTAFLGTTAIFVCFTLSALFATRRQYLFLGGFLSSAITLMMFVQIFSMFYQSVAVFKSLLYVGLFVFSAYVVYDTQLIVEKASMGQDDFVWHAAELFIDFVAIFVRLLIILLDNAEKKKKSNKNESDR